MTHGHSKQSRTAQDVGLVLLALLGGPPDSFFSLQAMAVHARMQVLTPVP